MQTIEYAVRLYSPQAHLFEVSCRIAQPDAKGQVVSLPAWIPGSYLIRDFARHIVTFSASAKGKSIALSKLDKHTWRCAPCQEPLLITYNVYAFDLSVRAAYFDTTRAYFNGTSLFVRVHGQEHSPCRVILDKPAKAQKDWQVATAMLPEKIDNQGFGHYQAQNYEELIDHPVEIGELAIAKFKACGVPHRIIISGRQQADLKRITRDLKTLCTYHIEFFGEPAPFNRYDFMLYAAGDDQYGGLEHSYSTSLICPRSWLPVKDETLDEEGYRDFLKLCSHEYFHAWHVKRIRPQAFKDSELTQEAYTRLLWVFEGFTAYYDALAVQRCGLMSREDYLQKLAQALTRLMRTPGRLVQPLEDSSFDSWIKLYRPDENTPNAQVSYYLKGSLVAMALDLSLRNEGKTSLDEVMKSLWQTYGQSGLAVPENAIEQLVEKLSGSKHAELFQAMLRDTTELPFATLFKQFAIDYEVKLASADKGKASRIPRSVLGLKLANGNEVKLAHVFTGTAAELAGLAAGDVIIAIDDLKVSVQTLERVVGRKAPGSKLNLHVFRRDELMQFSLVTQAEAPDSCHLLPQAKPDMRSKQLLDAWLR